jgi:ABC-2 type transport system ATP-binding protein
MPENYAIQVSALTKIYQPDLRAVNGLDLAVKAGEIMALLGPNGAGKSTTIRVLSTLSGFDSGQAFVGGINVDTDPEKVRQAIGVVAQKTGVDYFLTGRENLTLQGQMYRMKKADIRARVEELAEYFELKDSIDKPVTSYSGGMTRKLDIATALIHRPKILYLDEPTLGLDIRSRKILWHHIEELNRKFGLTILLTTHYLEEADKLAHRVAIINAGKIRIIGTPDELKNGIHGDSVVLSFENTGATERSYADRLRQDGIAREAVWQGNNLHLYVEDGAGSVPKIVERAGPAGVHIKTLSLARPTLDDVFLRYTGASMLEVKEEKGDQWWTQWAGKGGGGDWKKNAKKWGYVETEDGEGEWQGNEWVDKDGNPRVPADAGADATASAAKTADPAWQGNEWVDKEGQQKGDWGHASGWQGNQWVDQDGKLKPEALADEASESPAAEKSADTWAGNEWVDKEGQQKGDWGHSSGWQGNQWVDQDGKLKPETLSDDDKPASDEAAAEPSAPEKSADQAWPGNQWVDKEGHQSGDWGHSKDWKGNQWVDENGKPRGDWNQNDKDRS